MNPQSNQQRHVRFGVREGNFDTIANHVDRINVSHTFATTGYMKPPGEQNVQMLLTSIRMRGQLNPSEAESFTFSAKGATTLQVLNAKLFYTGDATTFHTNNQVGGTLTAATGGN